MGLKKVLYWGFTVWFFVKSRAILVSLSISNTYLFYHEVISRKKPRFRFLTVFNFVWTKMQESTVRWRSFVQKRLSSCQF